jgi:hypothetical protein
VYVYVDPRTDVPFYVGKGCGDRFISHIKPSSINDDYPVHNKILEIADAGFKPEVYIVLENLTEKEADYFEGFYIDALGRLNDPVCPGPLVNIRRSGYRLRASYKGVSIQRGRFKANTHRDGKYFHLGYYDIKEDAARIVDQATVDRDGDATLNYKLNFPEDWDGTTCLRPLVESRRRKPVKPSSGFIGVTKASPCELRKLNNRPGWKANIQVGEKRISAGPYPSKEVTARKRDELAIKYQGSRAKLNFPDEWDGSECLRMSVKEAGLLKRCRRSF